MMILRADARHIPLRDGSVQCVVTSPPYWGLRDYAAPGQLGIEHTPDAYVSELVAVFREVYRVLSDDGTAWLNLGDSYSAKELAGIPWRVAFALQADRWYLRSDIIWAKPNPMPESVTDRPTKSHEYVFLLTKSERYHYDADAIRQPYAESTLREAATGYTGTARKEYAAAGAQDPSETKRRIQESVRRRTGMVDGYAGNEQPTGKGANKRSVWTVPTKPFADAHFATMPEALVEPCILAGCPLGGIVFDPFLGSGTVGAVAERLGRRWVGGDLNADYHLLAKRRTAQRGFDWTRE